MSEIGFRVRNQNRAIQIDSRFRNHCLLSQGRVVPATSGEFGNIKYTDVPMPQSSTPQIVAIRGNNPTFYVMNGQYVRIFSVTNTGAPQGFADYYIFGTPNSDEGGKPGMRIRNRHTGETVYNSLRKYIRILNSSALPGANTGSIQVGRKCALIQNTRGYGARKQRTGPNGTIVIEDVKSTFIITPTDNTWEHRSGIVANINRPWDGQGFAEYNFSQFQASVTIIDVTGY
ncbi:hypothetical protein [Pseudomonas protegens]|uniref:Uncharacterized protein n=1 Tax=Pseudomonas protegens (strain DSM 19095 / LMG 27888 / CFBP 6595 / CHA0) TaxID=1124983 RepID=A0A2C9EPG2_PSEPH|nr:hypothetical protein [Pseudomonas protegens]AGL85554.1 hypothetical protein PFLCHA0_c37880 [Pseudomonas protegens CHA0]MBP5113818.1 hypothetical protein [Pseudomonas protegens]QTU23061.1 hypothetical protein HUT21_01455 [Pseudomonas protegens]QTU32593.1 hypothetical protein HUT20_19360 [Pseudomonas protegens]RLO19824.1 hypothetical protein EAG75_29910 [Pseudomonas protegens]